MGRKYFTDREACAALKYQAYLIEKGLLHRKFSIEDIGEMMPGSVMVHEIGANAPSGIIYMNNWGCQTLGMNLEELNELGGRYYERFFIPEEMQVILPAAQAYCQQAEHPLPLNFFQRVKTIHTRGFQWYYNTAKMLLHKNIGEAAQLLTIANPVNGIGTAVNKVHKALSDDNFIAKHYRKFALLSKREKEIIRLLCEGLSSLAVAERLFISKYTVDTHRKNICRKLEVDSFAGLVRFAVAFDLC